MSLENQLFNGPIPGQSLTQDPDSRQPWELPPKYNTPEDAMDHLRNVVSSEAFVASYSELLAAGRRGDRNFYTDRLAAEMLIEGFMAGLWTVDMMILLAEPTVVLMAWVASQLGEVPRFTTDTGYEDRTGYEQMVDMVTESEELTPSAPQQSPFISSAPQVTPEAPMAAPTVTPEAAPTPLSPTTGAL